MKINSILQYGISCSVMLIVSCSKPDAETPSPSTPQPVDDGKYIITDSESKLVSNLNGFRFEGAFGTKEPIAFPYLWVEYADDYKDSTRVVIRNQNSFKTITNCLVANIHSGKTSRYYDHKTFDNNSNLIHRFNHTAFILNTIDQTNRVFLETGVVFGIKSQVTRPLNYLNSYRYQLIDKYIIRYISGISLWPQLASSGLDESQFVATGELSDPKATGHYFDESFSNFPYDLKSNMYTGFFQSTLEKTYFGFAKGGENLGIIEIGKFNPNTFSSHTNFVNLDKSGDFLYLHAIVNENVNNTYKAHLYKMDINTKTIETLYADKNYIYAFKAFKNGNAYALDGAKLMKIKTDYTAEQIATPISDLGVQFKFGRNKIFAIVTDNNNRRVEVYSRNY